MARRKGEKPVQHPPLIWSEDCTIARGIRTGDRWLFAWAFQQSARDLAKRSGISDGRLNALDRGAEPTDEELTKLAVVLRTDPASLRASIEYGQALGAVIAELP